MPADMLGTGYWWRSTVFRAHHWELVGHVGTETPHHHREPRVYRDKGRVSKFTPGGLAHPPAGGPILLFFTHLQNIDRHWVDRCCIQMLTDCSTCRCAEQCVTLDYICILLQIQRIQGLKILVRKVGTPWHFARSPKWDPCCPPARFLEKPINNEARPPAGGPSFGFAAPWGCYFGGQGTAGLTLCMPGVPCALRSDQL